MKLHPEYLPLHKIERLDFVWGINCFHDILNEHIKIEDAYFLVKQIDQSGAAVLMTIQPDNSYLEIGKIWPSSLKGNWFRLRFCYNGIWCEQKIKIHQIRMHKSP